MSKAVANKILKEQGLAFIKIKQGSGSFAESKCMVDHNDKRMKGIYLWSHSPMDVTSVGSDKVRQTEQEIRSMLDGKFRKINERWVVEETSRTITFLYLALERLRTYSWKANLDDGYQTSYLVPYFTKEKK